MLQVNTAGSWRNVVEFDQARREEVLAALRVLAVALGPKTAKWCFVLDNGNRVWLSVP